MDRETIEREALNLPSEDRAKLAHELLESLDGLSPKQLDEAWLDESERRLKEIDAGAVALIPAEDVLRKARALLR